MTLKNLVKGLDQIEEERRQVKLILSLLLPFLHEIVWKDEAKPRRFTNAVVEFLSVKNIVVQKTFANSGLSGTIVVLKNKEVKDDLILMDDRGVYVPSDVSTLIPIVSEFVYTMANHSIKLRQKLALVEAAAKRADK